MWINKKDLRITSAHSKFVQLLSSSETAKMTAIINMEILKTLGMVILCLNSQFLKYLCIKTNAKEVFVQKFIVISVIHDFQKEVFKVNARNC